MQTTTHKFMLFETLKILFYKYISLYIYINKTKEINTRRANKKSLEGRYPESRQKRKKKKRVVHHHLLIIIIILKFNPVQLVNPELKLGCVEEKQEKKKFDMT